MMDDAKNTYKVPTPQDSLESQIMDPNFPKNEREWWAAAEITRLRAEVEALRADAPDAQRFRWMRDNPASIPYRDEMDVWCVPYLVSNAGGHGGGVGESRHKSLDAAIDAAIKSGLK